MWVTARVMRCVVLLVRAAIGLLLLLALVLLLARPATAAAGERQQLVAQVEQGDDIKAHRLHFEPHPRQHIAHRTQHAVGHALFLGRIPAPPHALDDLLGDSMVAEMGQQHLIGAKSGTLSTRGRNTVSSLGVNCCTCKTGWSRCASTPRATWMRMPDGSCSTTCSGAGWRDGWGTGRRVGSMTPLLLAWCDGQMDDLHTGQSLLHEVSHQLAMTAFHLGTAAHQGQRFAIGKSRQQQRQPALRIGQPQSMPWLLIPHVA